MRRPRTRRSTRSLRRCCQLTRRLHAGQGDRPCHRVHAGPRRAGPAFRGGAIFGPGVDDGARQATPKSSGERTCGCWSNAIGTPRTGTGRPPCGILKRRPCRDRRFVPPASVRSRPVSSSGGYRAGWRGIGGTRSPRACQTGPTSPPTTTNLNQTRQLRQRNVSSECPIRHPAVTS